ALASAAMKAASRPAIFYGDQAITYRQVVEQTSVFAGHLAAHHGLVPGQRVALWLKNCPEFVSAFFGILAAGGVVVPINNFLKPNEVGYILADAEVDLVITDASMGEAVKALQGARPSLRVWQIEDFPK